MNKPEYIVEMLIEGDYTPLFKGTCVWDDSINDWIITQEPLPNE